MTTQPKVRFKLSQGFDLSITLDIDISVLTPDIAEEVSTFWASKDEVREASEGNVYEAVARYAAGPLLRDLLDGWTPGWALEELSKSEGWPENHGITIIDYEVPDLSAAMWDVEELVAA